jgi:hypothetical protein
METKTVMVLAMELSVSAALILVVFLQIKHVICDGPLQNLSMVHAKRVYAKPLGVLHAAIHGIATFIILGGFGIPFVFAAQLAALETVLHYHIDFLKESIVKWNNWTSLDGPFWWAFTLDQALHHMTYVALVWLIVRS